jgi:hypothetical protein
MPIVGGLDIHRKQITFDYLDTVTGQVCRGQISPADRVHLRAWLARFAGCEDVAFAVEGCTGWRYVVEELAPAGVAAHLAGPADTAFVRGRKRHAMIDKTDCRHLRMLLAEGRLPECWIPPGHILECRALHLRPVGERRRGTARATISSPATSAAGTPASARPRIPYARSDPANVYLHYVLDLWADWWRKRHARGDVIIVRFADDFIVGFEYREDAERFRDELGGRFAEFGLELHPDKTRLIEFGRHAARDRAARGEGKPETFGFLGFTHICAKSRQRAVLAEADHDLETDACEAESG